MKKILVALLIGLTCVITSCDWFGDNGGDPIIIDPPKSPEFVQATAIPAVVEYNRSTTLKFKVLYADYVMVNNIKLMPEDSIKIPDLTSTTTINIIAFGKGGTFTSEAVTVTVLPAPVIPTVIPNRTDSLYSMVWSLDSSGVRDNKGNIIFSDNLTTNQKTNKYYFYKDGKAEGYDKNGTMISNCTWEWTGKNTIRMGDQYYTYVLSGSRFNIYQSNNTGTEISYNNFIGVKL